MSEIPIMNPTKIASSSHSTVQSFNKNASKIEKNDSTSLFFQLLGKEYNNLSTAEETNLTKNMKKNADDIIELETNTFLTQDLEDWIDDIGQLFENLSMEEGFVDPTLLQLPELAALLAELTPQLQQSVMEFVQSGLSFEHIFTDEQMGSKQQLTMVLLSLYQLEKKELLPDYAKQLPFIKDLQSQLSDLFKVELKEPSKNITALLTQLTTNLAKQNITKESSIAKQEGEGGRLLISRVPLSYARLPITEQSQITTQAQTQMNRTTANFKADTFDHIVAQSIKDEGSISRVQQYVLNVGHSSGQSVSDEQILRQLQTIIKQSSFTTSANGTNQLTIKLYPEHLGKLTIELIESNGEMVARMIASSLAAKETIEANLHTLKYAFSTQQLNVDKFEIQYQADRPFDGNMQEGKKQQDHSNSQDEHTSLYQDEEEERSDTTLFKDELFNMIV